MKHIHKIINELKTQQEQLNLDELQADVLIKERDFNLKLQERNTNARKGQRNYRITRGGKRIMTELHKVYLMLVASIPLFMTANIVGGVLLAEAKGEFDVEILKTSLIKYAGLLIMGALIYGGGALANKGIKEALDIDLHLQQIVIVGIATFGLTYLYQAVDKFNSLAGVKVKEEDYHE